MFSEHQPIPLFRGDLQGRGDHLGPLCRPARRAGAVPVPDPAIDRDHPHVLDDRARENAPVPATRLELGGQDHVNAVSRVDEAGVARRRPHPYRHRAGAGAEHRGQKPPLARSHDGRTHHRLSGRDRHPHRVAAKHLRRFLLAGENVPLAHRGEIDLEGREVLVADEGSERQSACGREHLARFGRLGGWRSFLLGRVRQCDRGPGARRFALQVRQRDEERDRHRKDAEQDDQDDDSVALHRRDSFESSRKTGRQVRWEIRARRRAE